ncbi:MAG: hypothetical protein ACWGHO_02135 [Candidatus Moraniibacteriota bacterium]
MDEKYKEDLNNRIGDCILLQAFLEVRFPGIKKTPVFKEVLSAEELISFNFYEELVLGKLQEICKKLDCNLDKYASDEEVLQDLRYLEINQTIVNHFFLEVQGRVRRKMTLLQRIKFLWENIKIIFSGKGGGDVLACN